MKTMKMKTVTAAPTGTPSVPRSMKADVVRKFRTKDRTKRIVVVRLPLDYGFSVQSIVHRSQPIIISQWLVPTTKTSEIPTSVWLDVLRHMAVWVAGHLARKGGSPSTRQERNRRKRFMKHALASYQEKLAANAKAIRGRFKTKPKPAQPLAMLIPYICLYDPQQSVGIIPRTTFRLHSATCNHLDFERKKAIRDHDGDSWVIEARSVEEARDTQLAEFDADDMGYDTSDFTIHECEFDRKLVQGKTVLGRVGSQRRRG